jgi:hypothetical protein
MPTITAARPTTSGQDSRPAAQPTRAAGRIQLLVPRWPAGRRRFTAVALAATGLAATFAAAIADGGHLGRGGAAQIGFAATIAIFAMGEALRSPAWPVIIEDRAPSGAARRRTLLRTFALVAGGLLAPSAGGAALGADWGTSLLTALAVACAVASITASRPGRQPAPGTNRARPPAGQRKGNAMNTRSPYLDIEVPEISRPRLVLDRPDGPDAAVPLLGPADRGSASPLTGLAAAGTSTPLMGPAAPASVTPLLGPADRGPMVSLMGHADPGTATPLMLPRRPL